MDWTSVFVEDGTEELIIPKLISAPRSSRLVSKVYHHQYHPHEAASRWELDGNVDDESSAMGGHRLLDWSPADPRRRSNSLNIQTEDEPSYSLQALYFLSINYILGVGCLGIPYAFARAGFLLCFVILLIVTLSSYMTVLWVAETGHRFEQCRPKQQQEESRCRRNHPSGVFTEHSSLLRRNSSPRSDRTTIIDPSREAYEVINLVQFYLGPWHKLLYQVSLLSLMYIGLLAYSQVFCGAIPALLWGPSGVGLGSTGSDTDTLPPTTSSWKALPQVIFGVLVVPLSCMELDEQITVQSIMALVRFVAIFIMVVGSLWALLIDGSHSTYEHAPYWAPSVTEGCQMSYTACFSGFGVAFSTSLFSQLFQHSIPGLIRPLQEQPEMLPHVPQVLGASLLTTLSFYLLLGTTAPAYFGAETRSSVNLNFANFTFGFDPATTSAWLLSCLQWASSIVVIFPALDTISVFPLIANTLGNNLYASAGPESVSWVARRLFHFQTWHAPIIPRPNHLDNPPMACPTTRYSLLSLTDRQRTVETASKAATIFWRLVAALPPLLGSLVATDLSFSFLLAGVAGIYVAFFAPSLLQLESSRQIAGTTIYTGWYSPAILCYPVLLLASIALGIVLLQISDALRLGIG